MLAKLRSAPETGMPWLSPDMCWGKCAGREQNSSRRSKNTPRQRIYKNSYEIRNWGGECSTVAAKHWRRGEKPPTQSAPTKMPLASSRRHGQGFPKNDTAQVTWRTGIRYMSV